MAGKTLAYGHPHFMTNNVARLRTVVALALRCAYNRIEPVHMVHAMPSNFSLRPLRWCHKVVPGGFRFLVKFIMFLDLQPADCLF